MNLSPDQLEAIEKFASNLIPPKSVANIIEVNEDLFMMELKNKDSDAYKSYFKGFYTTTSELRETIIGQAKAGSSPAQTQSLKFLDEVLIELNL